MCVNQQIFVSYFTFSLSVANNFLSSRFLSLPGASAIGSEELKINSLPEIPAD